MIEHDCRQNGTAYQPNAPKDEVLKFREESSLPPLILFT